VENTKTNKISLQYKDIESIYESKFWNTIKQNYYESSRSNACYKNIVISTYYYNLSLRNKIKAYSYIK